MASNIPVAGPGPGLGGVSQVVSQPSQGVPIAHAERRKMAARPFQSVHLIRHFDYRPDDYSECPKKSISLSLYKGIKK